MADSFLNIKLSTKGKGLLNVSGNQISIGKTLESRLGDRGLLKRDMVEIAGMIRDKIETNIRNAKNYKGGALPALRESTIENKGHSSQLFDTGKLASSVIVDKKGENVVVRMANKKYPSGVSVPQVAQWMQEGTKKHWVRPKKKNGVLSWTTAGGKTYFSRGHVVSGVKPMPFFGITKKDLTMFTKTVIKDRLFSKGGFSNLQNRKAV